MKRKILWKSDLWPITVAFGLMAIGCLVACLTFPASRDPAGAGGCAVLMLVLTALCAFTDRSLVMRARTPPPRPETDGP